MSLSPTCTTPRSLMSPMSPTYSSEVDHDPFDLKLQVDFEENTFDALKKIGFVNPTKITDTLQGSIYRVDLPSISNKYLVTPNAMDTAVVKITDKYLHKHSISRVIHGLTYKVNEDILLEQSILKYLTQKINCPPSIVKFHRFLHSKTDYLLIMEDGGASSLFEFVKKAHGLINKHKIELSEWKKVVKIIFLQMLEAIEFLHSHNIVHFDLSLENFLINDVEVRIERRGKNKEYISFALDDIQIKLCDFGMTQLFTQNNCLSSKFCGKKMYKSPEVIAKKKNFSAKKNDIWCMGVCLFMLCVGFPPFNVADNNDEPFVYIMDGDMMQLLTAWDVLDYFDADLFDLIDSIFEYEEYRISLQDIGQHSWVKNM